MDGRRPGEGDTGRASIGQFDDPAPLGIAGMPRLAQHLHNLTGLRMVGMGDHNMPHIL
jgi:hypothetical protein